MTSHEVADLIEAFARDVERLPGVSRNNPHAFMEAKSDLAHAMRRRAREMRPVPAIAAVKPPKMSAGAVQVAGRRVAVEVRGGHRIRA